jgi:hypothetical protein
MSYELPRTLAVPAVLYVVVKPIDTVEVWGSSSHGPTISFNELAYETSARQAPNGSILRDLKFPTTGLLARISEQRPSAGTHLPD